MVEHDGAVNRGVEGGSMLWGSEARQTAILEPVAGGGWAPRWGRRCRRATCGGSTLGECSPVGLVAQPASRPTHMTPARSRDNSFFHSSLLYLPPKSFCIVTLSWRDTQTDNYPCSP